MALVVADRVKETSTTAGSGTLTLAGASTGFQSFAVIGNGNTTYYSIVDNIAGTWEVGIGTYTSSGTTLSRDTVLANSSGTTSKITFAANSKDVFATYPAGKAVYIGSGTNIQLDFSNATVSSRNSFQAAATNASTGIYALPSGTATAASWQATNAADPTNASKVLIATNGSTDVQLVSGRNGTGTYLPLSFYTNGSQSAQLDTAANFKANGVLNAGNGLVVNSNTVSASYSIPSGSSAMSTGPITVASGQSVTVPSGSKWVVL